jgi:hypothetical protein
LISGTLLSFVAVYRDCYRRRRWPWDESLDAAGCDGRRHDRLVVLDLVAKGIDNRSSRLDALGEDEMRRSLGIAPHYGASRWAWLTIGELCRLFRIAALARPHLAQICFAAAIAGQIDPVRVATAIRRDRAEDSARP